MSAMRTARKGKGSRANPRPSSPAAPRKASTSKRTAAAKRPAAGRKTATPRRGGPALGRGARPTVRITRPKSTIPARIEPAREQDALRKSLSRAREEIAALKTKAEEVRQQTEKSLAEAQKGQGELKAKNKALAAKNLELEEYRKKAEGRIRELEARGKELESRPAPAKLEERPGAVTSKGQPLTLLGPELKAGDRAPDFKVADNSFQPAGLEKFRGKVKIISSVSSLDTSLCSSETHRFNEEAAKLPENVAVLTISMDLPFAQKRWCAAEGVERVQILSDYRDRSFGLSYGVLIKESKLLARAVFVVDDGDTIRYIERVPDIGQEPDYGRILEAVRGLL